MASRKRRTYCPTCGRRLLPHDPRCLRCIGRESLVAVRPAGPSGQPASADRIAAFRARCARRRPDRQPDAAERARQRLRAQPPRPYDPEEGR